MITDSRRLLTMILITLIIVIAALAVFHHHADFSDHDSCALCGFASTLTLFVITVFGSILGSDSPEFFRRSVERSNVPLLPEYLLGNLTLRAPPALLTA